jgi:hypothetical protein
MRGFSFLMGVAWHRRFLRGLPDLGDEAAERPVEPVRMLTLQRLGHVGVGVRCDRDPGVTEGGRDRLQVGPGGEHEGGVTVPEIVKTDLGEVLAPDLCGVVGYVELTQNLPIPLMI